MLCALARLKYDQIQSQNLTEQDTNIMQKYTRISKLTQAMITS